MRKQIKCDKCGAPMRKHQTECGYCGTQYEEEQPDTMLTPSKYPVFVESPVDPQYIDRLKYLENVRFISSGGTTCTITNGNTTGYYTL